MLQGIRQTTKKILCITYTLSMQILRDLFSAIKKEKELAIKRTLWYQDITYKILMMLRPCPLSEN